MARHLMRRQWLHYRRALPAGAAPVLPSAILLYCAAAGAALGATDSAPQPGFATLDGTSRPADLSVSFHLVEIDPPRIEVQLDFRGSRTGRTDLSLTPGWGGVDRPGDDLSDLQATDRDRGRPLEASRQDHSAWSIRHQPYAELRIRYALQPNGHRESTDPRVHYRPIVEPGLFHAMGELTLLRPAHLDNAQLREIEVRWVGFEERGWQTVSSFGVSEGPFRQRIPLRNLREGLFLAGNMSTHERVLHDQPVAVAVAGDRWSFDADAFADLVVDILELERTFFSDYDHPFFLVTLLPVGTADTNGRSIGGTSLYRSFATFTTANATLDAGVDLGLDIPRLLIHELFHQWNGRVLRMGEREERMYWFSEGFTSFYTRRFAIAGGWYDVNDFVADLNTEIVEYSSNPSRFATADTIESDFFTDRDVQRIPYLRGSLLAALLDYEIRSRSVGSRNIDDFMRELVREALDTPARSLQLTNDVLFARVAAWTNEAFAQRLRAIALQGAALELPSDLFAPALTGLRDQNGELRFARTTESAEVLEPQKPGR